MPVPELATLVEQEIIQIHEFFVDWFTGACPGDDATLDARLGSHLAPELLYVMPGGDVLTGEHLLTGLRRAHGKNPDFRIRVRDIRIRFEDTRSVLATYEELQRGARNSSPSDNARFTSVLFLRDGDRLRWRHMHETWLPEAIRAAGPHDF